MAKSKNRRIYAQFCPECARPFLRNDVPNLKASTCGPCIANRLRHREGSDEEANLNVNMLLVRWHSRQAALLKAQEGMRDGDLTGSKAAHAEAFARYADEVPF